MMYGEIKLDEEKKKKVNDFFKNLEKIKDKYNINRCYPPEEHTYAK